MGIFQVENGSPRSRWPVCHWQHLETWIDYHPAIKHGNWKSAIIVDVPLKPPWTHPIYSMEKSMVSGQFFPRKPIHWSDDWSKKISLNFLVGGWFGTWLLFSIIYGMSSFPLTHIFLDGYCTTNGHQPASFFWGWCSHLSIWLIGIKNGIIPWWIPFHSSSFLGFLSFFHSPWISDMPPGVAAMSRMAPRVKSSTKWGPLCLLSWFINHELITINYSYIMLYLP